MVSTLIIERGSVVCRLLESIRLLAQRKKAKKESQNKMGLQMIGKTRNTEGDAESTLLLPRAEA